MDTIINVKLDPHYHLKHHSIPEITIDWNGETLWTGKLFEEREFGFKVKGEVNAEHNFGITLLNKEPDDTVINPETGDIEHDKAVEIVDISVEGFNFDSIRYQVRCDDPPEMVAGPLYGTYICWNKRWHLPITFPAFTWIHKLENLGWIHE